VEHGGIHEEHLFAACHIGFCHFTGYCGQQETEDIAKQHDNTLRALRDGLPLILPSWSLPVYFGAHMDEKVKEPQKTAKQKK